MQDLSKCIPLHAFKFEHMSKFNLLKIQTNHWNIVEKIIGPKLLLAQKSKCVLLLFLARFLLTMHNKKLRSKMRQNIINKNVDFKNL